VGALWAVLGVLAVLHVSYSTWTAKRLDRLHRRVDAARAALDSQLRQRAEAALSFTGSGRGAASRELTAAAQEALEVPGLGHDREIVENRLSRALQVVARDIDGVLADATTRASFARRFHNDAVRDALEVRTRRVVRWFRLAGSARMPTFFEMDDTALERRTIEV
jgi:hypothetical protein